MKLRNLLSAVVLAGLGVSAMPAAAVILEEHPGEVPSNCHVTIVGPPLPLDVRGDAGWPGFYVVHCWAPTLPSLPRW